MEHNADWILSVQDSTGERIKISEKELSDLNIEEISPGVLHLLHDGRSIAIEVEAIDLQKKEVAFWMNSERKVVQLQDPLDALIDNLGMTASTETAVTELVSPMPGLVTSVFVESGMTLAKGDTCLILEAMKMENAIKAPASKKIEKVWVKEGQSIEKGQALISFSED